MFARILGVGVLGMGMLLGLATFQARAFDEGIDYATVPQPQPTETEGKVEVLEFFWYGCPHCWHLEPVLTQWRATMPANAVFRRTPAILGPSWEPLARAYFAAELMGKVDVIHEPLFRAVHVDKRRLQDLDAITQFVVGLGLDGAAFKEAYGSFFVEMQVRRAKELAKDFGLDGVPAIVVNGKLRTSATQTGSNEKLFEVVNALIKREAEAIAVEPAAPAAPAP
jgi:thiol:disulfide interchange protein DsbA